MKPGDRLVCLLVEPLISGEIFKNWPLHVTIVPWFRLEKGSEQLAHDLTRVWEGITPFEVVMGEENVQFGHQRGRRATLVAMPSPLTDVERRLRDYLHGQSAWLVDESTKVRREFRPHVTVQSGVGLHKGDNFRYDRLYVVEQQGEHKMIAAEAKLYS